MDFNEEMEKLVDNFLPTYDKEVQIIVEHWLDEHYSALRGYLENYYGLFVDSNGLAQPHVESIPGPVRQKLSKIAADNQPLLKRQITNLVVKELLYGTASGQRNESAGLSVQRGDGHDDEHTALRQDTGC